MLSMNTTEMTVVMMDISRSLTPQSFLSTWKIVSERVYQSFRCVGASLKSLCSPGSLSAVQTPVGCLQPSSVPRGNDRGLGLELFKASACCAHGGIISKSTIGPISPRVAKFFFKGFV